MHYPSATVTKCSDLVASLVVYRVMLLLLLQFTISFDRRAVTLQIVCLHCLAHLVLGVELSLPYTLL